MSDKAANAFRTISEVATHLGVPKHVLRFWEGKFPQVRPMKRGGGRRYYRPEDIELLQGIRTLLHIDGYTIKGVQKILRDQGVQYVKTVGLKNAVTKDDQGSIKAKSGTAKRSKRKSTKSRLDKSAVAAEQIGLQGEKTIGRLNAARRAALLATIAGLEECRAKLRGADADLVPSVAIAKSAVEENPRKRA